MDIPKKIHQIWVGPNPIPEKEKHQQSLIQSLNPSWTQKLWTDNDLTAENFVNLDQIQKAQKYAQKADIMRYEIVQRHGGVYIDMDFEMFEPFDAIVHNFPEAHLLVCNEHPTQDSNMSIGFFAGIPNHPALQTAVEKLKTQSLNSDIVSQTGPVFWRTCIDKTSPTVKVIPTLDLYPKYQNGHVWKQNQKKYGIHHWHHSWK